MTKLISSICLIALGFSCSNPSKSTSDSVATTKAQNQAILTDSLSIDLVELKAKGFLKNTKVVIVENDPVYHKTKRFNAIFLKEILEKYSSFENLNPAETKVVFECEDGYRPEMPLENLLSASAFLAVSDADAPKGREWEQIMKDGHEMKAEPFYVVYEGKLSKKIQYQWPYNLVKIYFAPLHENDETLNPKNPKVAMGYKLFIKHCLTCHSINMTGGKMGPELNYPKSVAEYWNRDDLKAFIQHPAAYRNEVKMPDLGIKAEEAEQIVMYLEEMNRRRD